MTLSLQVAPRDEKESVQSVRSAGKIPAIIYGPKQPSVPVTIEKKAFDALFKQAGESTIVTLQGLRTPIDVLIHDVDFNPTKGGIMHADLYAVEAGKEITTDVQLVFVGESPVEKIGGMVSKILHEVEVTCMPGVLPAHIDVDISTLTAVDDKIHVSDLVLPKGVTVGNDPTDVVALAVAGGETLEAEAETSAEPTPAP